MEPALIFIGAVAGFLVGQASEYLKRRAIKKESVNKVLADLLEIRHRFKGSIYIVGRITKEVKLPPDHYDQILEGIPEGILWDPKLSGRYNSAVDTLANYSPLLAFLLRAKDIVGVIGSGTSITFGNTQESFDHAMLAYELIAESLIPELDQTIETVASLVSKKTKTNISQLLEELGTFPPEVVAVADKLIASINRAVEAEVNNQRRADVSAAGASDIINK